MNIIAIGGRLEVDNADLFGEIRRLSGGRIAVLATASALPEQVGQDAVEAMRAHGIAADLLPVDAANAARSTRDPDLIDRLNACGGVYFTGGDQSALVTALRPDGVETALLKALRRLAAAGGLISGSSAGAAALPPSMILGGTSMDALVHGLSPDVKTPGLPMGPGLDFFPLGMIDQHFLKRGRIGRLLLGTWASGQKLGFGIDENTGLVVEGTSARVVGETGVVLLDLTRARIAADGTRFEGVRVSYLDSGDGYDLGRRLVLPGPGKRRVGLRKTAFTTPARSWRHIFGSYAFSELMVRLAEADHRVYSEDRAVAYDTVSETEICLTLSRPRHRSKVLAEKTETGRRHTIIGFDLGLVRRRLPLAEHDGEAAMTGRGRSASLRPRGRLICLGSTPARGSFELMGQLKEELAGPIGIVGAASEDARRSAQDVRDLFADYGMETVDLGIGEQTIGSANENPALIERIRGMGSIVFGGGNQRRLVDALLDHGHESAVLKAIGDAYRGGATLVAVSGAASALSRVMIAGGGSYAALRYGIASGGDSSGIVVEEGFGLFDLGILDQNLVHRNRLGRLIVACAEEQSRFGFGLVEESGVIVPAGGGALRVFGRHGMAVVEIDHARVNVQSDSFLAEGLRLWVVRPGESFATATRTISGSGDGARTVGPASLLDELARECRVAIGSTLALPGPRAPVQLRLVRADDRSATIDIASLRSDE